MDITDNDVSEEKMGVHDDKLGAIVEIDGVLYRCISIAYDPTITFEPMQTFFPSLSRKTYVIGSKNYTEEVKPVKTI